MRELAEEEISFGALYDRQGAVMGYHWSTSWIPIAYFVSGDQICVDMNPSPSGKVGQVIEYIHDDSPRDHLAMRITDYFGWLLSEIKADRIVVHEEYRVLSKRD